MAADAAIPGVLESAEFIATHTKEVRVRSEGVEGAAVKLWNALRGKEQEGPTVNPLEPRGLSKEEMVEWIFLLDTLNFCFWSDEPAKFTVKFAGKEWTGYRAMRAALARAVQDDHIPVYKPSFYRDITKQQLSEIFRSETHMPIPLLEQRQQNLHEAAAVLEEKFGGKVSELVRRSEKSAERLVQLLASNFSSYRDVATYNGRTVSFLKRAQIFTANLWDKFDHTSYGEFHDIDKLTMFPDYRVPQCLLYLGVLEYSDELMGKLQRWEHLEPGSPDEVEIRGCSVWAVECLRKELQKLQTKDSSSTVLINSVVIDYYLWNYAQLHADKMAHLPIHRTLTICY